MKKVLCALGLMFTAVSSGLATTYPLTIENCGYQETFTRPPERVVALGQNKPVAVQGLAWFVRVCRGGCVLHA